jgi:hypothetical protein
VSDSVQLGFPELADFERETRQQIQDLLFPRLAKESARPVPLPATKEQQKLLWILRSHFGRQRAIPLQQLCEATEIGEREVKDQMRSLVVDFKVRIGAARTQPYGYYLVTTADEAREAAQVYESEIIELAKRVRVLRGKHFVAELLGQLRLENEQEKAS